MKEEKNLKKIHDQKIYEHYRNTKEKLQDMKQKVHGVIKKVKYESKYMIIESKYETKETYLGLFSECTEYISSTDNILNREVLFFPEEREGKKIAASISLTPL